MVRYQFVFKLLVIPLIDSLQVIINNISKDTIPYNIYSISENLFDENKYSLQYIHTIILTIVPQQYKL